MKLVGVHLAILCVVLMAACGAPASPRSVEGSRPQEVTLKKRLVASVFSEPPGLQRELIAPIGGSSLPGLAEIHQLMNAGLSYLDDQDVLQPQLAEAVPTVDNGLWRVLPDGRMETSWHLKPGILWHDGTPLTTDDLVFAAQLNRDKDLGILNPFPFDLVEAVEAPDPRTILVRWRAPFIEADTMFSWGVALPLPRHILEQPYTEDKSTFFSHSFWTEGFIGTGPYRMVEWVAGSHLILAANDRYTLGRPRIDEMEIRFITDMNTVIANHLAGTVEKHLGTGPGVEQVLQIRDMAKNLNLQVGGRLGGVLPIYTQFLNTDPPIVLNVEFRRALLRAIDRQEMTDTINYGLGPMAHAWLEPDRAEYRAVESQIVRYEYDPRRAAAGIEALGYTMGSDGIFRDAAGQRLHLELRTTDQVLIQPRSAFPVADYWKRLGVDVEVNNVPNPLIPDREYRSNFPAFELVGGGQSLKTTDMRRWVSSQIPLPENRYQGLNRTRLQSPALDGLIERYVSTIPQHERMVALGEILHFQTDQLTLMPLFYRGSAAILGSQRLKNITGTRVWNAHLWDLA